MFTQSPSCVSTSMLVAGCNLCFFRERAVIINSVIFGGIRFGAFLFWPTVMTRIIGRQITSVKQQVLWQNSSHLSLTQHSLLFNIDFLISILHDCFTTGQLWKQFWCCPHLSSQCNWSSDYTQSHERQLRAQQNNPVTPTLILDPQNNKQNCCHFVQMLCSWSHIVQFVNALARFDCKGQQSDLTNYNEMTSVAVELFINIELQQRQGDIIRTTWLQIVLLSKQTLWLHRAVCDTDIFCV